MNTKDQVRDDLRRIASYVDDVEQAFQFHLDDLADPQLIRLHERLRAVLDLLSGIGDVIEQ